MNNKPSKRVSSLEAAGVKSSSNTTSSSSSTVPKKKVLPTPISTKVARISNTPTSSPVVSHKLARTPIRTRPNTNTPPTTPLLKKKPAVPGTPTAPTVRSANRTSSNNHAATSNPPSSRASTPNSTSTTILKRKSLVAPNARRQSFTTDSLAVESLKDKNTTMQKALVEKEELLLEKEKNLKEMKVKLEKLQHEIENNMRQQSIQDRLLPSKPEIENSQEHKEQELLEKIQLLQNQSAELKQYFDSERLKLQKQNEEEKQENREIIEKLREKLESEKLALTTKALDKEREVEKLKKDMDEMRDNIRDMHQTHQTRLTTLTNQLNQQHTNNLDKLRSEYETRLNQNDKDNSNEGHLKFNSEVEGKASRELDLLQTKYHELELSTEKEKEDIMRVSKEAINTLENKVQKLELDHAETEAAVKAELDQYKIKLQMSNEKLLQVEEDLRKNRQSVQLDVTQLDEEYSAVIERLKEVHETEKSDIATNLKEEYDTLLNSEKDQSKLKYEELVESHKDELKNIEKNFELQLLDYREKNLLLIQKLKNAENKMTTDDAVIKSLQEKQLTLEQQIADDNIKYKEFVTKYDVLKTDLSTAESRVVEKDAEIKSSLLKLETKHNLIIEDIKLKHQNNVFDLKKDYAKDMKLAECQTSLSCAGIEIYENKIRKLEKSKQLLKDELEKVNEQLINQSEEQEALLLQAKSDANEIRREYNKDQEAQISMYIHQISELKSKSTLLESKLQSSNEKYHQSMQELKETIINETFPDKDLMHLNSGTTNNLDIEEDLDVKSIQKLLKELLGEKNKKKELLLNRVDNETTNTKLQVIIEQHQKELNVLQNQFQCLLDMKDKELDDLSYGIKSRNGSLSVDLNGSYRTSNSSSGGSEESRTIEIELRKQLQNLEEDVKSKSLEMRWLESDSEQNEIKIKDQGILIHNLQLNNNKLDNYIKQLKDENDQMLRLIHQLQGEIHHL